MAHISFWPDAAIGPSIGGTTDSITFREEEGHGLLTVFCPSNDADRIDRLTALHRLFSDATSLLNTRLGELQALVERVTA